MSKFIKKLLKEIFEVRSAKWGIEVGYLETLISKIKILTLPIQKNLISHLKKSIVFILILQFLTIPLYPSLAVSRVYHSSMSFRI